MKKVAIIGTQGVPAQYGGFESLAENLIGEHKSKDVEYTVYCSSKDYQDKIRTYKSAQLKYVNFHANGAQSVFYDAVCLLKTLRGYDTVLALGNAAALLFPLIKLLSKSKYVVNIDGLDHERDKFSKPKRFYLKLIKKLNVKYGDVIVSDNKGIQDYVLNHYHRSSELIAYGGDHTILSMSEFDQSNVLNSFGLKKNEYAVTVCRIEPENNCHVILDAFSRLNQKIIFIGNWNKSEYGRNLKKKYANVSNIILHDPVYDLNYLFALRNNAFCYMHGHSVGGTNPSLVEAMFFGKPIIAYNVIYNRETTFNKASYFSSSEDIIRIFNSGALCDGKLLQEAAYDNYTWKKIVSQYEALY